MAKMSPFSFYSLGALAPSVFEVLAVFETGEETIPLLLESIGSILARTSARSVHCPSEGPELHPGVSFWLGGVWLDLDVCSHEQFSLGFNLRAFYCGSARSASTVWEV